MPAFVHQVGGRDAQTVRAAARAGSGPANDVEPDRSYAKSLYNVHLPSASELSRSNPRNSAKTR